MTSTLLLAFALMLVLEGLMPFIAPAAWRKPFAAWFNSRMARFASSVLTSMLIGLVMLMIFS
ncbi:MAG: DUF2065 family protein [Dechloromonas sp.]|uniref:DUF2065 family protein n=1 Tax=Candidatus Dechloromonas phosphorivorans TaxID=2899244 RepID=A0A9D7LQD1_9RHOO|nr:DUF2065 family protein [Candidatus Dechloromonas phosphorivorans]